MIDIGTRVQITDPGDEYFGRYGTVTCAEHPAVLTGRPMVEVRIDGTEWMHDVGFYLGQFDEIAPLRVVA